MSRRTLPELYRSWAFSGRARKHTLFGFVPHLEPVEERLAPATLPAPTVLTPSATAASNAGTFVHQDPNAQTNGSVAIDYTNPQVVADPTNPLRQVLVATRVTVNPQVNNGQPVLAAVGQLTTDGGQSWTSLTLSGSPLNDPTNYANNSTQPYVNTSSPSVAIGRDGTLYFVYLAHNADKSSGDVVFQKVSGGITTTVSLYQWVGNDPALNPTIAVDNNLPSFTDPTTGKVFTDQFVSPATLKSKGVYVAWNGNLGNKPADVSSNNDYNANPILAAVSTDDGATFSNPTAVSSGAYVVAGGIGLRGAGPQIAFSPGTSAAPGSLVFVWPQQVNTQNYSNVAYDASRQDGGSAGTLAAGAVTYSQTFGPGPTNGDIPDATVPPPPPPNTTVPDGNTPVTFSLNVPASTFTDPNFSLKDLSVDLSLVDPRLGDLSIVLKAPNGQTITLLRNRTDGNGNQTQTLPNGLTNGLPNQAFNPASPPPPAAGLGIINGDLNTDTVFSDQAGLRINDPNAAFPYIGAFRPEGEGYGAVPNTSYILPTLGLTGATAAQLAGTWTLTVTDYRNDRFTLNNNPYTAPEYLQKFGLTFSSVTRGFGTDRTISGATAVSITPDATQTPALTLSAAAGGTGSVPIPSSVSVAFDQSLGSFSPFAGQMYVAYTSPVLNNGNVTDTDINLARGALTANGGATFGLTASRVNDDAPTDNYSQGNRPQFTPSVSVDATTGTVVATWYDTRTDANKTRAATFLAASLDGGATWSDQTFQPSQATTDGARPFLNEPKRATDTITNTTYTLQPVPTNIPLATTQTNGSVGVGNRMAVIAAGGKIYAYWAGNLNAVGSSIESARAVTAAGPRVIGSDTGAVLGSTTASGFTAAGAAFSTTYNTAVAADGTQGIDGFVVSFDRPIDPTQFTGLTQAQLSLLFRVQYHNPYDPVGTVTVVPVSSVDVFYANNPTKTPGAATSLLVHLATPQYAVGTYSYAVGPGIKDRIRTAGTTTTQFTSTDTPLRVPTSGTGGSGTAADFTTSTVTVPVIAGSPTLSRVQLRLDINHTYDGDLRITLIGPDGTAVVVKNPNINLSGDNFTNTILDDTAAVSIEDTVNAQPPFTGTFKPANPLTAFAGKPVSGAWKLQIQDNYQGDSGTLLDWSLTLLDAAGNPIGYTTGGQSGNAMDQNANGVAGQAKDVFSNPATSSGTPFTAPYTTTTLPLIIPGPHVISTTAVGSSAADPLLVNAGVATAIDVTFDRDISTGANSFTNANIIRLTGPTGVIYDRATQSATDPLTVTRQTPRTYTIGFPGQVLSGTYTIEVDPQFAAATPVPGAAAGPALIDTNLNAGLDVLRSTTASPGTATSYTSNTYQASFTGAAATIPAAAGQRNGVQDFPLVVPNSFLIALGQGQQVGVQLNVTGADNRRVVDLIGDLISPPDANGNVTTIRLFTNVGNTLLTPGTVYFSNTQFRDNATTPIQNGAQPFDAGPYNPQFPLAVLNGEPAGGTWTLRITNTGAQTPTLTRWALTLPQAVLGTGLGEATADRFQVSFRVFNQNPNDPLTQKVWTPVGSAPEGGGGSGPEGGGAGSRSARTNGLAVDPSDPSGNTVYLGAASGGIWKTTNFLSTDDAGPTWVPLTDSGPAYSLNVVSIAVFPRNNDPQQSIIFAATGEGDTGTPGVGVLRSLDGGKTWTVLDSTNNADAPNFGGNLTDITAASRDRKFVGVTSFKIVVDPTAAQDAAKSVTVYLADGAGLWRSVDTGLHWTLMKSGTATDVVLAAGSAGSNGQLQTLYAAFRGDGVYRAQPATSATSLTPLLGTPTGNGSFIDADSSTNQRVPINAPSATPNGNKGRILLATPALTTNAVENLNYQGWLYALVITGSSSLDGLYLTKDFGQNWTKVSLAEYLQKDATGQPTAGFGTNDYTQPDHDPFAAPPGTTNPLPGQGNYDVGFAIDPQNPNVVYIGGTNDDAIPTSDAPGDLIRVDTTGVNDAGAFVAYDNGAVGPNDVQFTPGTGNAVIKTATNPLTRSTGPNGTGQYLGQGQLYGFANSESTNTGLLNVLRDPNNPFEAGSPLYFSNIANIRNTGTGARISFFPAEVDTDIHRILTSVDPVTGLTRVMVGDDMGVSEVLDAASGRNNGFLDGDTGLGTGTQKVVLPDLDRNGNLQTVQFYSSYAQPGQLAAQIAGSLFYGIAQDNGFPQSDADILQAGELGWNGGGGDGTWGLADQTGTGTNYQYLWPCCGGGEDFFQVNGQARVNGGLLLPGDNPTTGVGDWPKLGGSQFAVNPVDSGGIAISSVATGRLFLSTNQGVTWTVIGGDATRNTNPLDGTYAPAVAFGAPDPANPNALDNFIYAGTSGGKIFVTFVGGGQNWTDISAGLDGSPVQRIDPSPGRGTYAAYAVTAGGVFFKADARTSDPWVNVTNNLFKLTKPIFASPNPSPAAASDTQAIQGLAALAVDWRFAIPNNPTKPALGTHPVLYVGGDGGIAPVPRRRGDVAVVPPGDDVLVHRPGDRHDQDADHPGRRVLPVRPGHPAHPVAGEHRPDDRPAGRADRRAEPAHGRHLRAGHLGDPAGGLFQEPDPGGQ